MKKKLKCAILRVKSGVAKAFSLVELMVTLIVISCIITALVPVITKKLKSQAITVGGSGGGGNLEFNQDCSAFGTDCALCFDDRCSLCTKVCESFEYVSTADCVCKNCIDKDEKCISCTSKACNKCDTGYGLDSITKTCKKCETNQYSDGTIPCTLCPENHYCNGSASVMCPSGSYSDAGATSCIACADTYANCATCNKNECLTCKKGYKLKDNVCIVASGSKIFTAAGEYEFVVPEAVDEITVTLVSGGAGGGGGKAEDKTVQFTTVGINTWTIPATVKGQNVTVSAVGGGGGGGTYAGGAGGAIKDVTIPMPNAETIQIFIGEGGKGTSSTSGADGGNAGGGYGKGASYWNQGGGGYDPLYSQHGQNGGASTSAGCYRNCSGGAGSWLGGGGGGGVSYPDLTTGGGGGGGATLFYHLDYGNVAEWVAPGGGGGGGRMHCYDGCWYSAGGSGGGAGGGKGGNCAVGNAGSGSTNNVLGSSYGGGGAARSAGGNGAMKIVYKDAPNGGTGGGAGHIVPKQKISVTAGQVLKVTVGAGGAGGNANQVGTGADSSMISKIVNSEGITLLSSAPSITTMGATGGNPDGTTVGAKGYISSGINSSTIEMAGFSNTNGNVANVYIGGNGGSTTIEGLETLCSVGIGGSGIGVVGGDATGFGGCGGGGGGAGAKGGAGAPGYVKISWGD